MISYPKLYREIKRMAKDTALRTATARAIVRKSGIRRGVGDGGGGNLPSDAYPRTLIDAYIDPKYGVRHWQWDVDLTNYRAIRFVNRSTTELWLYYSLLGVGSSVLDPGDYEAFPTLFPDDPYFYPTPYIQAFSGVSEIDGGNPPAAIPLFLRVPLRISISTAAPGFDYHEFSNFSTGSGGDLTTGFSMGVEVL